MVCQVLKSAVDGGGRTVPPGSLSVISPTGGHAGMALPNGQVVPVVNVPTVSVADTDEEMLTLVRKLIRSGADVIKACTTGGCRVRRTSRTTSGCPNTRLP